MKVIKRVLLIGISLFVFGACFNPPEYDNKPSIAFEDIYFGKSVYPGKDDSLVVSLSFKDGDGDLGLTTEAIDSPFHAINFLANNNGEFLPVSANLIRSFNGYSYKKTKKTPKDFQSYYLGVPPQNSGELITLQSRSEGFPSLPPYEPPFDCIANKEAYLYDTIYIFRDDSHLIKNTSTIVDTLVNSQDPNIYYFAVLDYFYVNANPYQYNIQVQFFVKNNDGTFTEYDWRKELCTTWDGRFPILADKERPLEGTINYSMLSSGFLTTFSIKRLKLLVTVFDRALNSSNTVETKEFTFEEITR